MNNNERLACVVIGYNEVPFAKYESFLRNYGENTEAYRDLRFSFVDLDRNPHHNSNGANDELLTITALTSMEAM